MPKKNNIMVAKRGRRPQRNMRKRFTPLKPGQFSAYLPYTHTYRFDSGPTVNNVAESITALNLLGAAGVFTSTTNTTVETWYSQVKVLNVRVWSPCIQSYSSGTGVGQGNCSIIWAGSENDPGMQISDTTNNVSVPAFISTKPPAGSSAAFWNSSAAGGLFYLTATPGSIVEVTLSLSQQGGSSGASINVGTAALGSSYFLALDGPGSNKFAPVGLITTS
jgi:hypothetical protein